MVEERLAACVNILSPVPLDLPLAGRDRDRGRNRRDLQDHARARRRPDRPDRHLHSYDVPCVVTWPIDKITSAYANWVEDSVG